MNQVKTRKLDIEVEWALLAGKPVVLFYHVLNSSGIKERYLDHYTLLDSLNGGNYSEINFDFNGPGDWGFLERVAFSVESLRDKIEGGNHK